VEIGEEWSSRQTQQATSGSDLIYVDARMFSSPSEVDVIVCVVDRCWLFREPRKVG
jgi:hypothetical protein